LSGKSAIFLSAKGPDFYNAICFDEEPMNGEKKGTSGSGNYNIPTDDKGKNILTGEEGTKFTCTALEVYRVII
jgi:hypothetical protein